jgi:ribosomal protein S20
MPIKKAGFKALRQSRKKTEKNDRLKRQLDYLEKKFDAAVSKKDAKAMQESLPTISQAIDKAVKAGVLKANTGARKKSRISRAAFAKIPQSTGQ